MILRGLEKEYEEKHGMHTSTSAAASTQVNTAPKKKKTELMHHECQDARWAGYQDSERDRHLRE